ncbi:hypothetical protein F7R20_15475 [Pseudomonas brassicacearum subsp. brassicacearum]|nr:hypothetical protein F7R20_15475 [Pseudomonas brassicacearum subsp. brassicacearum]QEO81843.1 hypothetical protein ELZ14_03490 [Pseudomonas brassicacearum]
MAARPSSLAMLAAPSVANSVPQVAASQWPSAPSVSPCPCASTACPALTATKPMSSNKANGG